MNRRGFLGAMLKAGVGSMLLPSATTYARRWVESSGGIRFVEPKVIVPNFDEWLGAPLNMDAFSSGITQRFWLQTTEFSKLVNETYMKQMREVGSITNARIERLSSEELSKLFLG